MVLLDISIIVVIIKIVLMETIFAGDLSFFCKEVHLQTLFNAFGAVKSTIIRRGKGGENLQYGFIQMSGLDARKAVVSLNGTKFMGRKLRLNIAEHANDRSIPPDRSNLVKVLVSFVSHSNRSFVNEEVLDNIFSEYGEVDDCTIKHYAIAADTGKYSGYGFVYFLEVTDALRAIQVINQELQGHVQGLVIDCHLSHDSADRLSQQSSSRQLKVSTNVMPSTREPLRKIESWESSTSQHSFSVDSGAPSTSYRQPAHITSFPPHIQIQSPSSASEELLGPSFSSSSSSSSIPSSPALSMGRTSTFSHFPPGTIIPHISTMNPTSRLTGSSYKLLSNLSSHSQSSVSPTVYHHSASNSSLHSSTSMVPGMIPQYFHITPSPPASSTTFSPSLTTQALQLPVLPPSHSSGQSMMVHSIPAPTSSSGTSVSPVSMPPPPPPPSAHPSGSVALISMVPYPSYPTQTIYSQPVPPHGLDSTSMTNNNTRMSSTPSNASNMIGNSQAGDAYGYVVPMTAPPTTIQATSAMGMPSYYHPAAPAPPVVQIHRSMPHSYPAQYLDQNSHVEYTQQAEVHYNNQDVAASNANNHAYDYSNYLSQQHYHPNAQYPSSHPYR